jgi:hypothetical protein
VGRGGHGNVRNWSKLGKLSYNEGARRKRDSVTLLSFLRGKPSESNGEFRPPLGNLNEGFFRWLSLRIFD